MNILMIDTAEGTRVLLAAGDNAYYRENLTNAGAETLMPAIDAVITEAGIKISDIELFGASIGPGSFTGLRVGLATVKTMCYALGKKCFGVNNLRLNSYNNDSGKVISIAHAGNGVCYIAMFDGEMETMETKCVTAAEAQKIIEQNPDYAVTTDVKLEGVFLGTSGIGQKELMTAIERRGEAIDEKELLPLYVRKAQPERGEGDL